MRPSRYPYSKPQWEKRVGSVYSWSSDEPIAKIVTYKNKITNEVTEVTNEI